MVQDATDKSPVEAAGLERQGLASILVKFRRCCLISGISDRHRTRIDAMECVDRKLQRSIDQADAASDIEDAQLFRVAHDVTQDDLDQAGFLSGQRLNGYAGRLVDEFLVVGGILIELHGVALAHSVGPLPLGSPTAASGS